MEDAEEEIALAFCRECLGWKDVSIEENIYAPCPVSVYAEKNGHFHFRDVGSAFDAARGWLAAKDCWMDIRVEGKLHWIEAWHGVDALGSRVSSGSGTDLCHVLLAVCVDASRALYPTRERDNT